MKIGIDASRAFLKERTGTEEYSYRLLRQFARSGLGTEHEVVLYVKKGAKANFELPANYSLREVRGNFLWTQLRLMYALRRDRTEMLFVPAHTLPFLHPKKSVATIHGLEFKNRPDCYSWRQYVSLDINTRLAIAFAAKIIVPTQSTKQDLIKYYRVPAEKISVVHHGSPEPSGSEKEKEKGGDGFHVLFVGRIERRKNILVMVRAFNRFMRKLEETPGVSGEGVKLILAGKKGLGWEEVRAEVLRSPYRKNICGKGHVTAEEKDKLFRKAGVFLFPSLAEGFGLPALEAMSYSVPVIASRIPALAEVCGDGALLVEPTDEQAIADALWKIYASLGAGDDLIREGSKNLRRFSWEKCARETWKILTTWT